MCPVKGGAYPRTIIDSIQLCLKEGKTLLEAIGEIEGILHCKLPENILARIHQECV